MRSVKSFSYVGHAEEEGQRGCAERALCEASAECIADTQGPSSIFCQLGSWVSIFGFNSLYTSNKLSTNMKRQHNSKFMLCFCLQYDERMSSVSLFFAIFLSCRTHRNYNNSIRNSGHSKIGFDFLRYATSYLLQRQSGVGFEVLYEAGRRGRTGEDCRTLFMDCNAVWTSSPSQYSVERGLDSAGFWNLFADRI